MFRQIAVYILSIGLLGLLSFRHPYHVGVTTLLYHPATKTAEISIKMIYHDLEPAVNKAAGTDIDIKNHANKTERDSLVYAYTFAHFELMFGDQQASFSQKSISFKDEYVLIRFTAFNPSENGLDIRLTNTMCFEMEPSQTHIFHANQAGRVKQTQKAVNPQGTVTFDLRK